MVFPARKPVDEGKVKELVEMIVKGSNDSSVFGGIVWAVKRSSSSSPFLIVKHTESAVGSTFRAIRCGTLTCNAVLDAVQLTTPNVAVYPERY